MYGAFAPTLTPTGSTMTTRRRTTAPIPAQRRQRRRAGDLQGHRSELSWRLKIDCRNSKRKKRPHPGQDAAVRHIVQVSTNNLQLDPGLVEESRPNCSVGPRLLDEPGMQFLPRCSTCSLPDSSPYSIGRRTYSISGKSAQARTATCTSMSSTERRVTLVHRAGISDSSC